VKVTGYQIRAGRGALNWSVRELASRAGVGTATLVRYEENEGVPKSRKENLQNIVSVLEAAGIEFIGGLDDAPGIRIHKAESTK
jgi:transcriptional regulator with XRE-family HTH domain